VDLTAELPGILAACGTIDLKSNDGAANFVKFYASGGGRGASPVSRLFFFRTSEGG
jgi:hypothetical protein